MVTSSNPNASGTASAAGIGPAHISAIIGIIKAYCSRVGNGPFVTELFDEIGDLIRDLGHEYGTTTGRPRRCGWLDLVLLKNATRINSITEIAINHVDTVGKLPEIKVCIGYELKDGKIINDMPMDLKNVKPIYKVFEGNWNTEGCTSYEELPERAKQYIEYIEKFINTPIKYIGVGPSDTDLIIK